MENNAVALVFINNHPKGNPHPSKDNKFIIKKLKSRMEIVVTFLAVLDLVREGVCKLNQVDVFGEIELIHLQIKS